MSNYLLVRTFAEENNSASARVGNMVIMLDSVSTLHYNKDQINIRMASGEYFCLQRSACSARFSDLMAQLSTTFGGLTTQGGDHVALG
jgi:hypothetical protein